MERYQTNSLDLFSALFHLTYENENVIEQILQTEHNETIDKKIATFERKPKFQCNFDINYYNKHEQNFYQFFDFQHLQLHKTNLKKYKQSS